VSEYTPTTDEVRERIGVFPTYGSASEWRVEFDRWLAENNRAVAAKAVWLHKRADSDRRILPPSAHADHNPPPGEAAPS
jgi:hypothetical protein